MARVINRGGVEDRRYLAFAEEGLVFAKEQADMRPDIARTAKVVAAPVLEGLLSQIEDEGFSLAADATHVVPWGRLYDLLEHSDYGVSLWALGIPRIGPDAPVLE